MKKTLIIFLISLTFILLTFLIIDISITGYSVNPEEYSFTRAICNESNYCQDYEIDCYDKEILKLQPITGASIQHLPDWKDPRENVEPEDLCKI